MLQDRLFRLAPAVLHLDATFVDGEGWRLTICMRRADEEWPDAYRSEYTFLSTGELLDVICSESGGALGFA